MPGPEEWDFRAERFPPHADRIRRPGPYISARTWPWLQDVHRLCTGGGKLGGKSANFCGSCFVPALKPLFQIHGRDPISSCQTYSFRFQSDETGPGPSGSDQEGRKGSLQARNGEIPHFRYSIRNQMGSGICILGKSGGENEPAYLTFSAGCTRIAYHRRISCSPSVGPHAPRPWGEGKDFVNEYYHRGQRQGRLYPG